MAKEELVYNKHDCEDLVSKEHNYSYKDTMYKDHGAKALTHEEWIQAYKEYIDNTLEPIYEMASFGLIKKSGLLRRA